MGFFTRMMSYVYEVLAIAEEDRGTGMSATWRAASLVVGTATLVSAVSWPAAAPPGPLPIGLSA